MEAVNSHFLHKSGKRAKPVAADGQSTNPNPFPTRSLTPTERTMSDPRTSARTPNVHSMGGRSANYIFEGFQSLLSFSTENQIVVSGAVLLCDTLGIC